MKVRHLAIATVLVAALAVAGCTTKVVTAEGAAPLYTITASGTGETLEAPDMAQMYFGATVTTDDAATALSQANDIAKEITSAVKSAGVAAEDIQTANVSVYPQQNYEGDKVTITGYQATIQVSVKVRDIESVGDVIGAASGAGANEISGPSFVLDDDAEASAKAIELAIEDARARAEVMAKAAGKSLGEIISVSETGASAPVYYGASRDTMAAAESVAIEPGQLNITTSVTVVFELK